MNDPMQEKWKGSLVLEIILSSIRLFLTSRIRDMLFQRMSPFESGLLLGSLEKDKVRWCMVFFSKVGMALLKTGSSFRTDHKYK